MNLTQKQLKQIILQELREAYKLGKGESWMVGTGDPRTRARKRAEKITDAHIEKLKSLGYDDEQASILAQDLGSEEHEPVSLNWEQAKPFILADIKKAVTKIYSDWKNRNPNKKKVPEHVVKLNKIPLRNPIIKKWNPEAYSEIVKSGWPSTLANAEMVSWVSERISMTTDRVFDKLGLNYQWWEPEREEYQQDFFGEEELMEIIRKELQEMARRN
jgi:hypothetical protein